MTTAANPRHPQIVAIADALADPFDPREIKFKPQMVKNNRAMAMAYIDARLVQDRLDDVLGVENWQDRYDFLPDGSVVCRLRVSLAGRWITKTDVGSPSEQPDSGDRVKAAVSDALKRAAVKLGVGRYLYRLPAQWCDYDPVKKQLTQLPQLPPWAIPKGAGAAPQKSQQQPPDPRRAALSEALKAAGWSWAHAVGWLNSTYPAEPIRYTEKTRVSEIEPERVDHLIRAANTAGAGRSK